MTKPFLLGVLVLVGVSVAGAMTPPAVTITTTSPEALRAFEEARYYLMQMRHVDAARHLGRAIQLDPDFAFAHAYLGLLPPASEEELEKALALGARLPEPEKWFIESLVAMVRGNPGRSLPLLAAVTERAPADWHARYWMGFQLLLNGREELAEKEVRRGLELAPDDPGLLNLLGYSLLWRGKAAEAQAVFRRYLEVAPSESNPHDSLGEALLAAGQLEAAEASFRDAQDGWRFPAAAMAAAQSRYLAGDRTGARELLALERANLCPHELLGLDWQDAWFQVADGDTGGAMDALTTLERKAGELGVEVVEVTAMLDQALVLILRGQEAAAIPVLDRARQRLETAPLAGIERTHMELWRLSLAAQAFARAGLAAEADDAAARAARIAPHEDVPAQSAVRFVRAQAALARGDLELAASELSRCRRRDSYYLLEQVQVLTRLGRDGSARVVADSLRATLTRDPRSLVVRQLSERPAPLSDGPTPAGSSVNPAIDSPDVSPAIGVDLDCCCLHARCRTRGRSRLPALFDLHGDHQHESPSSRSGGAARDSMLSASEEGQSSLDRVP